MSFSEVMLIIVFMGIPIILTITNIYNLIAKKQFKPNIIDSLIFILGFFYSSTLYSLINPDSFSVHITAAVLPFQQPLINYPFFITLAVIALMGYMLLRMLRTALPHPAIIVFLAAMGIGSFICIIWIIQVLSWVLLADSFPFITSFLCLFPFNYIVSTISLVRRIKDEINATSEEIEA